MRALILLSFVFTSGILPLVHCCPRYQPVYVFVEYENNCKLIDIGCKTPPPDSFETCEECQKAKVDARCNQQLPGPLTKNCVKGTTTSGFYYDASTNSCVERATCGPMGFTTESECLEACIAKLPRCTL